MGHRPHRTPPRPACSCGSTVARALAGADLAARLADATDEDWDTEFHELVLAVGVVDSVGEAIEHINVHGSGHSEAIVTRDTAAARSFELGVDAACVYVNAFHRRRRVRHGRRGRHLDESVDDGDVARVGILGGTFNPPHLAHLVCASEAASQLGLDRVLLTPVAVPPHKEARSDPGGAERLALCRLAVAGDERLAVCDLEIARGGPSYTVDPLAGAARTRAGGRSDLHPRGRRRPRTADLARARSGDRARDAHRCRACDR